MKRGDLVIVAAGAGFGGKPRPALVIQADDLTDLSTVVLAIFTTELGRRSRIRPQVDPDGFNGLREPSRLMADLPVAVRREKIGPVIGRLASSDLDRVQHALLLVLGFAR